MTLATAIALDASTTAASQDGIWLEPSAGRAIAATPMTNAKASSITLTITSAKAPVRFGALWMRAAYGGGIMPRRIISMRSVCSIPRTTIQPPTGSPNSATATTHAIPSSMAKSVPQMRGKRANQESRPERPIPTRVSETATERKFRILVVEDDAAILRVLQLELEHEGYEVEVARDGLSGLEKALKEPDLVILDLMLPKMDGLEICSRVRAKSKVPIIMLTAKDRIPDRVAGLDTGADDYLTKPFSIDELLARIRARLRDRHPASNILEAADLVMDRDRHEVSRAGKPIQLTAKEYALLEYL